MKNIMLYESYCKMCDIDNKNINILIGNRKLNVNILSTPKSLMTGYKNKSKPSYNEGLLFVFPSPIIMKFWMDGVDFDLDILFFDKNKKLIEYTTMKKNNKLSYESSKPGIYAVETKAGFCEKFLKNHKNDIFLKFI